MTGSKTHSRHGAVSAAQSPGEQLRAARERAGWPPERLAAELCLPVARLHALEADDHAGFGGVVYVRGYLRRAAALLGLPPAQLVSAYEDCCNTVRPAEILPGLPPGRPPRRGLPAWIGPVAGVLAVAAVIGTTWWLLAPTGMPTAPSVAESPSPAGLEFSMPEEPPAARPEAPPAQASTESPADPREPGSEVVTAEVPPASPAEAPPRLVSVVEEPERPAPLPGTVELRFEFSEDCWLEVTDADERRLAYRLHRAGDVARLRGKAPVAVFLGNAEGVRLSVDGSPIAVRPAARRDGTARLTVGGGAG